MDAVTVASSLPYPWPWDRRLSPARLALVAVGCQRAWADATSGAADVLAVVDVATAAVRAAGGLVVVVRHHRPSGSPRPHRLLRRPGEPGWGSVFVIQRGDLVVDCGGVDAFFGGSLDTELRCNGRDLLAVCGLGLETAVYSTMT